MEALKQRIRRDARNLGGGILKVDTFINHQIDVPLTLECACHFAARFRELSTTKILTAETSGIGPALLTAMLLGVPLVFARKHKPVTMPEDFHLATAPSHTKGGTVKLLVSAEVLTAEDRVLIIDDFLATGHTIKALAELVAQAQATLVGIGTLIEKRFEGGRKALTALGVPIEALVTISAMPEDGSVLFAD